MLADTNSVLKMVHTLFLQNLLVLKMRSSALLKKHIQSACFIQSSIDLTAVLILNMHRAVTYSVSDQAAEG